MSKLKTVEQKENAYDPKKDPGYVAAAGAAAALEKQAPSYENAYRDQLEALYKELSERRPFSYSVGSDPLYRQYREQYTAQGRLAMEDTVGQAAALTGGYSNTYAQAAGQQAYQGYLRQLNQAMPELYALAQERYAEEGRRKQEEYDRLAALEAEDYRRFREEAESYEKKLSQAQEAQDLAYDRGYRAWLDAYEQAYREERDREKDRQWETELQEDRRRYDQEWAKKNAPKAAEAQSSEKKQEQEKQEKERVYPYGFTREQVIALQMAAGLHPDGWWNPDTEAAYRSIYG